MAQKQESITTFTTLTRVSNLTRPADTTVYTAGDVISDATGDAHFTFSEVLRPSELSAAITVARLHSDANQTTKIDGELWLFHTDIAAVADNAAFVPSDAEMLTLIGVLSFSSTNWKVGTATVGTGGNAVSEIVNAGLVIRGGRKDIYGQLVVRNGYTPISGEIITAELIVTQD